MPHRPYSCGTTGGRPPRKQNQTPFEKNRPVIQESNKEDSDEDMRTDQESGHRTDEDIPTDVDEPTPPTRSTRSLKREGALDGPAFTALINYTAKLKPMPNTAVPSVTAPTMPVPTNLLPPVFPPPAENRVVDAVKVFQQRQAMGDDLKHGRLLVDRRLMRTIVRFVTHCIVYEANDVIQRESQSYYPTPHNRIVPKQDKYHSDDGGAIERGWARLREHHMRLAELRRKRKAANSDVNKDRSA
ncbi:hypothetical protein VNI00_014033 [Paramarasmius palmivorus]|uniref:Uncharacterized protein n=1 Tax=Paramarasmius palmivorus TaxID=297713 RepID=A0AAW0BU76_9AGAR